jgi:asparagine synthase (glutamine-hydrolysing)
VNRTLAGSYDPRATPESARRLAVDALGGGADPDVVQDGPFTVAATPAETGSSRPVCLLDGRIYNLETVAREAGVPSAAAPEEVLAELHARLGEAFLERLRGDFAIVIWRADEKAGLLACDQMGFRSLAYRASGDRLFFASEIRELLRMLDRRPAPDPVGVSHWLGISSPPPGMTLYEGVRRVEPGHLLRFGAGGVEQRRYWAPRYQSTVPMSRAQAAHELRDALVTAVERCCSADEPSAAMVSGGLDSSTVAAVGSRLEGGGTPAALYSAVFPKHPTADESEFISVLAEELGLPSVRLVVEGGSVIGGSLDYLRAWELPPVSPNLFFWDPLLGRVADDGASVMLDGEGGDALFFSSPYLIADRLRRGRLLSAIDLARRLHQSYDSLPLSTVAKRLKNYGLKPAVPIPTRVRDARRRFRDPQTDRPDWFTPETARTFFESDEKNWNRHPGPRWAAWLSHLLTTTSGIVIANDHVRRRNALAGITPRHPLYDVDLVELVFRLPPEHAFDPHLNRPLVREAMIGIMPEKVRLRPDKSNFDSVFHEMLCGSDLGVAMRLLLSPDAKVRPYVRPEALRARLERPPPDRASFEFLVWVLELWRLVMTECWLRAQENPSFPDELQESGELGPPRTRFVVQGPHSAARQQP